MAEVNQQPDQQADPLPSTDLNAAQWIMIQRRNAQAAALSGVDADPQQAADALQVSETSNVPATIANTDVDFFKQRQKSALISAILDNNEHLRDYALSHPLASKISSNDWGQLDTISQALDKFRGSYFGHIISAPSDLGEDALAGIKNWWMSQPSWLTQAIEDTAKTSEDYKTMGLKALITPDAIKRGIELAQGFGPQDILKVDPEIMAAAHVAEPFIREGKVPPVGLHPMIDQFHSEQAKLDGQNLKELESESAKSETRELNPEFYARQFLDQHPDFSIGIDAEAVRKLYGDKVPEADDNLLGWVPRIQEQLELAGAGGGDIQVPLADWLAKADPEVQKELHDFVRVRPGGVTLDEAKTLDMGEAPKAEESEEEPTAAVPQDDEPLVAVRRAAKLEDPAFVKGWQAAEPGPKEEGIIPASAEPYKEEPIETDVGFKFSPYLNFPLGDALKNIPDKGIEDIPDAMHDFYKDRLARFVGDVPVRVVSDEDWDAMNKAHGIDTAEVGPAFYVHSRHEIYMAQSLAEGRLGQHFAEFAMIHEGGHALSMFAMKRYPELAAHVKAMAKATKNYLEINAPELLDDPSVKYAFKNDYEFWAQAWSSRKVRNILSQIPMNEELARALGLRAAKGNNLFDAMRRLVKLLYSKLFNENVPETMVDGLLHLQSKMEEAEKVRNILMDRAASPAHAPPSEPELPGMTRLEDRKLFEKAGAIGMTEAQMKRYAALIEKRRGEDAAHQEKIAQQRSAETQTAAWKDNFARVREDVAKDIRSRPDIAADLFFRNGELYGEKVRKPTLNGESLTPEQRAAIPKDYLSPDGMHPDDAAGFFGYQSGSDLVDSLGRLEAERQREGLTPAAHLTAKINAETDRQMRRDYGTLEQSILEEAKDHVISQTQLDMLHEEMLALGTHAKSEMPIGKDDVKAWVKDKFNATPLGTHSSDQYLKQAGKAGAKAEQALLDNSPGDAFKAKQQQYISLLLANEAKKLEKEKGQFMKEAVRNSKRERGGVPQEYMNWVHDILMRTMPTGFVRRTIQDLQREIGREADKTLEAFVNSKNANPRIWEEDENLPSDFRQMPVAEFLFDPAYRRSIEDMNPEEFRAVHDSIKTIIKNGRDDGKINVRGEKVDLLETIVKMTSKLEELFGGKEKQYAFGHKDQGVGHALRTYWASLLQMESIFNRFDRGDPKGIFFKTLTGPLFDAGNGLAAKEREFGRLYRQIKMPKDLKAKVANPLFVDPLYGERRPFTKENLLAVLQNVGNPSQMDKLARGYIERGEDGKISAEELGRFKDNIMNWLFQNTTKEDWDRAQALGDLFEKAFEESATMYHNLSGVAPERVELHTITTPFGEYRGWYHPIIYDPNRPGTSKKLMGPQLDDGAYYRVATPSGYTKRRTGYAAPIQLNFTAVPAKLRSILNDAAMRPVVNDVAKIFYNADWQKAITKYYGKEVKDLMIPYLKDVAGQKQYKDAATSTALRILESARQNIIATLIGLNPATVMKHAPTAAMLSINEVGPVAFLRELKGLLSFSDELGEQNWKFAMHGGIVDGEHWGGSEELQRRHRNWQETLTGAYSDAFNENTLRNSVIKFGATPVALSDLVSAVPTWLAAYKAQIRDGATHGDAVSFADRAVRRAHGSSAVVARGKIMRGGAIAQWATPFYTFFSEMFQRQYEMAWRAKDALGQFKEGEYKAGLKEVPYLASGLWAYVIFPALIEQLVSPVLTGKESEGEKVLGYGLRTLSSSLPIVRDLVEGFLQGRDPSVGLYSTGLQTLHQIGSDIGKKEFGLSPDKAGKTLKDSITTIGMATGLTNAQEGRTAQYVYNYSTGREHPKNFGALLSGLWHGTSKVRK